MAVRIRLRRMGRKKQPHYRIVVADGDSPRDGRFVEALGYYRPLSEPARLVLDLERVDYWIGVGALPSDTVGNLINKARQGGDDRLAVGEEDHEARRVKRAEELAARRAAEKKAVAEAAAAAAAGPPAQEKAAEEDAEDAAEPEAEGVEEAAAVAVEQPEAAEAADTPDAPEELEGTEESTAEAAAAQPEAEADDSGGDEVPEASEEDEEKDS